MTENPVNKRKHARKSSNSFLRVYTSITSCAYTVQLKDISKKGAFIHTKHLPEVGETITFVIVDDGLKERLIGNATVVRTNANKSHGDVGFAIELDKELVDEFLADV